MSERYKGSAKIAAIFSYLYIYGTLTFSFAFPVRGLGIHLHKEILEKTVFAFMVSTGGLAYIFMVGSGIYMLRSFFRNGASIERTI
jgi:hypothetical protein